MPDTDDDLIAEMRIIIAEAQKYRDVYGEQRYDGKVDFTIEQERGETYRSTEIALYGHRQYEPGSVLEGQSCRHYLGRPSPGFLDRLPDDLKQITEQIAGTTHRPVEQMVAHLPGEDDTPPGGDDLPDLGWEDRHGDPSDPHQDLIDAVIAVADAVDPKVAKHLDSIPEPGDEVGTILDEATAGWLLDALDAIVTAIDLQRQEREGNPGRPC